MAQSWYPFYVGDYARKTAHLSMLEHGAYRLLLDHYYATGEPLPDDNAKLFRICRARTPSERKSVLSTVAEFFTKDGTLLRSKKCDRELNKQLNYSNSQSAKAKLRHSHGNAVDVPRARSTTTTTTTTTKEDTSSSPLPPTPPPDSASTKATTIDALKNENQVTYHGTTFHPRYNEVRDYIIGRLPSLKNRRSTEVNRWLLEGADVEFDIIPSVDYCIDAKRGDIGTFEYFTPSITSAIAVKTERMKQEERMREKYAKSN